MFDRDLATAGISTYGMSCRYRCAVSAAGESSCALAGRPAVHRRRAGHPGRPEIGQE